MKNKSVFIQTKSVGRRFSEVVLRYFSFQFVINNPVVCCGTSLTSKHQGWKYRGVTKTQTSKTQTPKNSDPLCVSKTQTPEKFRPLCISKTQTSEKRRPTRCIENSDPVMLLNYLLDLFELTRRFHGNLLFDFMCVA